MDKNTLSQYGWVVIVIIIICILLGLASGFGTFVKDAAWAAVEAFDNLVGEKSAGVVNINKASINPDSLKSKYTFTYYNTLQDGFSNQNQIEDGPVASFTDSNGLYNVIILDNINLDSQATIDSGNLNLILGGKQITAAAGAMIKVTSTGSVSVDGTTKGSKIVKDVDVTATQALFSLANAENITINGGEYSVKNPSGSAVAISANSGTNFTLKNSTFNVEAKTASGIQSRATNPKFENV